PASVSIRPMAQDDQPQILEIEKRCYPNPWSEESFRAEIAKPYSHIWVLTDDETDSEILGYVVFWLLFDECQILNIAVDLPHRGLGHAQRMIGKVIQEAIRKNCKRALLDVRKSNQAAIQLYQKMGFFITQLRREFYSNGEDAYQMSLDLSGARIDF